MLARDALLLLNELKNVDGNYAKKIENFEENLLGKMSLNFSFDFLMKFKKKSKNPVLDHAKFSEGVRRRMSIYKNVLIRSPPFEHYFLKENFQFFHFASNLNFWVDIASIMQEYQGDFNTVVQGLKIVNKQLPSFVLRESKNGATKLNNRPREVL